MLGLWVAVKAVVSKGHCVQNGGSQGDQLDLSEAVVSKGHCVQVCLGWWVRLVVGFVVV